MWRIEHPDRILPILHKPCGESTPSIDLKIGALTHQDIGQMDGYVRMWDELGRATGDNPTIGLILCNEKSQTIARYSVLQESQPLFASKYRLHLPTEEELATELKREILAIEEGRAE